MIVVRPVILAALAAASPAMADDCATLRAAHGPSVYMCSLAFNDGSSAKSKHSCFVDVDEGFRWMGQQASFAKGPIFVGNCRNDAGMVRYRDWAATKGLDEKPDVRMPKNPTSPAEQAAEAERAR
ncbi:hypothetical protein [Acuticoccus kandeliae]|uniref:hypothetical protein n=1 Tax=Acuticoccus kandeliae TaxID=2073160 RepID=UPI0013005B40|nr:hypothetical protein [Acuticoccus kandeliae]